MRNNLLVIKNGFVMTLDPERRVFQDGAVVIEDDTILEVGQSAELSSRYPEAQEIDASDHAVLPGLINAHTHLFQMLSRGIGDGLPLQQWLDKCVWPIALRIGRTESKLAALAASAEMIKSGTTTFVDSHYITVQKDCYDGIAEAIEESGIRGVIGRSTADSDATPSEFRETVDTAVKEAERVIKAYHGKAGGRINVRVEPLNEFAATREMVLAMRDVSRQSGVGFSMHAAETATRIEFNRRKYGHSTIRWLSELGVLGYDVLLAHCVWVDDEEIDLLASTDTAVAHNPVANQYLADGIAPVPKMLAEGVRVAVATDGSGSNNSQNVFEALKSAVLIHRVNELDSSVLTAERALELGTIDAARAIGLGDQVGSLEPGKKADIILVDLNRVEMLPAISAVSNLVFSTSCKAVDTVMVNGRLLMENRHLNTLNETEIVRNANKVTRRLVDQAGIDSSILRTGRWKYQ